MSVRFNIIIKKAAAVLLAAALIISGTGGIGVRADQTAATGSYECTTYKYTVEVTDYSTTFTGANATIDVVSSYELFQIQDDSKAAKKINKYLRDRMNAEYKPAGSDEDEGYGILELAQTDCDERSEVYPPYYDTYSIDIAYRDNDYLSLTQGRYWYAGGVSNTFCTGLTFDLATGKRAKITDVTGLTLKKFKKKLLAAIKADPESKGYETAYKGKVKSMKAGDFDFYLLPDKRCAVTFEPYEPLGWGGWSREYVIEY